MKARYVLAFKQSITCPMPELPEVETVRRGLEPLMSGRRLDRVQARRPDLRFPLPDGFGQRLTGQTVIEIRRRAKYLLFDLSGGETLIAHLGMSGSFRFPDPDTPLNPHDHVLFFTDAGHADAGREIRYRDPRRFGFMDLTQTQDLLAHPMLAKLGPEPLSADFSGTALANALKGKKTPIKSALLDQRVVAGVGNIYACEALHLAGISPKRSAHTVQGQRAERLSEAVRQVLTDAIQSGGSTLRDHVRPDGELGYFQHSFQVYDQFGSACPVCGPEKTIQQIVQAGRSTFFCSGCQG